MSVWTHELLQHLEHVHRLTSMSRVSALIHFDEYSDTLWVLEFWEAGGFLVFWFCGFRQYEGVDVDSGFITAVVVITEQKQLRRDRNAHPQKLRT